MLVSTTPTTSPPPRPLYFWRPHQEGTGYLSQWHPSAFTVSGATYATCEMWMMVQKARLFSDESAAAQMLETTDPKVHKALGREVRGFEGRLWDRRKFDIVVQGNLHKFTVSEDAERLREWLLATGERELVEASPMDRIWGIGFAERDAAANRHRWGQNLLGKALMEVRAKLRKEEGEGGEKETESA
ncbi:uncharacterized protein EKO05_0004967 [Ascochyta rabiei]|uniref:Uncharacterized protein n=1 Tax=Didymella rabiei TaxID=5454 RepID=A0A163KIH4_DIDRA|nr:uncharacterized protein EKO05_0004967 [Ascochyta rabiei]KZM27024.1 hypothetical protein ST47_g1840 [Ascochyta rabiei]UPX14487.1 hypothetical protein EKO05_0004967 [Ascochyta rabiei]